MDPFKGGMSVTLNTNADSDTGGDHVPRMTTDSIGNWVTVWSSHENLGGVVGTDNDIFISRSTDNGESWSPPVTLNTNADSDTSPDQTVHID